MDIILELMGIGLEENENKNKNTNVHICIRIFRRDFIIDFMC